eukprot:m.78725 g.78725  ORF g.78725 m.78725 type:complete len:87 (-) comp10739_c0_seq1:24-284(-)
MNSLCTHSTPWVSWLLLLLQSRHLEPRSFDAITSRELFLKAVDHESVSGREIDPEIQAVATAALGPSLGAACSLAPPWSNRERHTA